jgi:hypothetical protein
VRSALSTAPNVVLLICFDEDFLPILEEASRLDMLAHHAWIACTDTPLPTQLNEPTTSTALRASAVGFRTVTISPRLTPSFARATAVWRSMSPDNCSNGLLPDVPAEMFDAPPPDVFGYAYDAAAAMAMAMMSHALATLRANNTSVSSSPAKGVRGQDNAILYALRAQDFDGATGRVRFDPLSNGDRDVTGLELLVFEWALRDTSTGAPSTDAVTAQLEMVPRACMPLGNTSHVVEVPNDDGQVWPGGLSTRPVDLRQQHLERQHNERHAMSEQAAAGRANTIIMAAVLGALTILALPLFVRKVAERRRLFRKAVLEYERLISDRLSAALVTTREFEHAAVLISCVPSLVAFPLASTPRLHLSPSRPPLGAPLTRRSPRPLARVSPPSQRPRLPCTWRAAISRGAARPRPAALPRRLGGALARATEGHLLLTPVDVVARARPNHRAVPLHARCDGLDLHRQRLEARVRVGVVRLHLDPAEDALCTEDRHQLARLVRLVLQRLLHRRADRRARRHGRGVQRLLVQ